MWAIGPLFPPPPPLARDCLAAFRRLFICAVCMSAVTISERKWLSPRKFLAEDNRDHLRQGTRLKVTVTNAKGSAKNNSNHLIDERN